MKLLDRYTDLDGNVLSLTELKPEERRLVTRLRRQAGRKPRWQDFESFGQQALDWFWTGGHFPFADLFKTTAFRVLEDLTKRLQIAQGATPSANTRVRFQGIMAVVGADTTGGGLSVLGDARKIPHTYVDLYRKKLSLARLKPGERRVIERLCRRARGNPKWESFEQFGLDALADFQADRSMPLWQIVRSAAYKVFRDLRRRLHIAQGAFDAIRDDTKNMLSKYPADQIAARLRIPRTEIEKITSGGNSVSLKDIVLLLIGMHCVRTTAMLPNGRRRRRLAMIDGGDPGATIKRRGLKYRFHFIGGPEDGRVLTDFAPYCRWEFPGKVVYEAKMDGELPVVEEVDERTRGVRAFFRGNGPEAPYPR